MFYSLDSGVTDKETIGGKASNLVKMKMMNLPVPNGFVCPTNLTFSKDFERGECFHTKTYFNDVLKSHIRWLAQETGTVWAGSVGQPLIVSVRSGAPISMPGMMDTILNIGLTKDNIDTFCESYGASRGFAYDCYRRLIQMFAVTVKGVDAAKFNEFYNAAKTFYQILDDEAYVEMVGFFEKIYEEETGEEFPQDPNVQLLEAVNAVYKSWFSEKAKSYRAIENIDSSMGTAVTVQKMVFGNLDASATGVVFTHDPNSGEKGIYGEYLKGAQGEDVVAGTHKVSPIKNIFKDPELAQPAKELQNIMSKLLIKERDILDLEFTIERSKLYVLQYRIAKRSKKASVRTIIDMSRDGALSSEEATARFLEMLPKEEEKSLAVSGELSYKGKGLGATEGEVTGKIAITHKEADDFHASGEPYVFVASETNPEDSMQMKNSIGILTSLGGKLSHAAVVARGWNKPCVVSFEDMVVCDFNSEIKIGETTYKSGDPIKINGETGEVWA